MLKTTAVLVAAAATIGVVSAIPILGITHKNKTEDLSTESDTLLTPELDQDTAEAE